MKETNRFYAFDLMKFVAVLMVTNSHFIPLYKDVNVSFATFGMHGNALFFFVSGFLLLVGLEKDAKPFLKWYGTKLVRLLPAPLIWAVVAPWLFNSGQSWLDVLNKYWFFHCILVYYVLFYFVGLLMIKYPKSHVCLFLFSIIPLIVWAFCNPKVNGSIFHSGMHYVCHFSVMVLGGMVYLKRNKILLQRQSLDWLWLSMSFVVYFVIMYFGKGRTDWHYYIQLLAIVPIYLFCYYAFKVCSGVWASNFLQTKIVGTPFLFVASLSWEIYIVQFHIITDKFNNLFPFNTLIVFGLICMAACVLNQCVSLLKKNLFLK